MAKHRAEALLAQDKGDWTKAQKAWEEVLELEPNSPQALFGRAVAKSQLAISATNQEEKEQLLREAIEDNEKAILMKPGYGVCNNLGTNYSELAFILRNKGLHKEFIEYINKAKNMYILADDKKNGVNAYNVACTSSLLGDEKDCKEWLTKFFKYKKGALVDCRKLLTDPDLESVRNTDWFNALMVDVCPDGNQNPSASTSNESKT